jgi:hypothetical protein
VDNLGPCGHGLPGRQPPPRLPRVMRAMAAMACASGKSSGSSAPEFLPSALQDEVQFFLSEQG